MLEDAANRKRRRRRAVSGRALEIAREEGETQQVAGAVAVEPSSRSEPHKAGERPGFKRTAPAVGEAEGFEQCCVRAGFAAPPQCGAGLDRLGS